MIWDMIPVMRGSSFKYGSRGTYSLRAPMRRRASSFTCEHGERTVGFRCVRVCRSPYCANQLQA